MTHVTFEYETGGQQAKRKREDTRKGYYCPEDLYEDQIYLANIAPITGESFFLVNEVGSGKTRISAKIIERIMLDDLEMGIHTGCIVVGANKPQCKMQIREFGSTSKYVFTNSGKGANTTSVYNMMACHLNPTILMCPQMFNRACGNVSVMEDIISKFGPDTKHIVIVIDEVHSMVKNYSRNVIKHVKSWQDCFKNHTLTIIGVTATLNFDKSAFSKNAAKLIGVDEKSIEQGECIVRMKSEFS